MNVVQLLELIAINLADNSTKSITEAKLRAVLNAMVNNGFNLEDSLKYLRASEHDSTIIYRFGDAVTRNGLLFMANKNTSGAFNFDDWDLDEIKIFVDLNVNGGGVIDLMDVKEFKFIRMTTPNADETITGFTNAQPGMRYKFIADNSKTITFVDAAIGATPDNITNNGSGDDIELLGRAVNSDWCELEYASAAGNFIVINYKNYV